MVLYTKLSNSTADRFLLSFVEVGSPMPGTFTSVLTKSMLYGALKRTPNHSSQVASKSENVINGEF